MIWDDNKKYQGFWKNGHFNGHGTLTTHESKYEGIVGRMKIQGNKNDDSTIYSQNWCPHSHIKNSRVKDDDGNPVEMIRQSKPYFTEDPVPGVMSR